MIIVDDNESVWNDNLDNLITVEKYNYFTIHDRNHKSHAEMKNDETESEGLLNIHGVLRRIHGLFFDSSLVVKDVSCLPF